MSAVSPRIVTTLLAYTGYKGIGYKEELVGEIILFHVDACERAKSSGRPSDTLKSASSKEYVCRYRNHIVQTIVVGV